jgi:hypothetical protein
MPETTPTLMILIAGPYASGAGGDPELMRQNLRRLETAAWPCSKPDTCP